MGTQSLSHGETGQREAHAEVGRPFAMDEGDDGYHDWGRANRQRLRGRTRRATRLGGRHRDRESHET